MTAVARLVSALGAVAVLAIVFGVVAIVSTRQHRSLARDFLATGTRTVATDVVVHVETSKGGDYVGWVDVEFAGQRLPLIENLHDAEGNDVGEHAPKAGTRYAAPLAVLYKRDDPAQVMAVVDADEFAASPDLPPFAAGALGLGGTGVIGLGALWWVTARVRQPAE
ncbi:hypothetical protein ACXJJ3_41070 [Kribbella sp. WER1]